VATSAYIRTVVLVWYEGWQLMRFEIPGTLPNLNTYTKENRSNKYAGNNLKKDTEKLISLYIPKYKPYEKPVTIEFHWVEPNKRRDLDNIAFAKKFILDALVKSGVLQGDGWRHVEGFTDKFSVDKKNPRVEVSIYEED